MSGCFQQNLSQSCDRDFNNNKTFIFKRIIKTDKIHLQFTTKAKIEMLTFSLRELASLERTCDRWNECGPTGTSQRSVCSSFSVLRDQEVSACERPHTRFISAKHLGLRRVHAGKYVLIPSFSASFSTLLQATVTRDCHYGNVSYSFHFYCSE